MCIEYVIHHVEWNTWIVLITLLIREISPVEALISAVCILQLATHESHKINLKFQK